MTSIMTEQSFSSSCDQYCTHESDFNYFYSFFGGGGFNSKIRKKILKVKGYKNLKLYNFM